jgi:DNA (cytosine-5)-methyltransferase 1
MLIGDFFSGAGGAARGFQNAGHYVIGIDHNPQPNYCGDEFIQADAMELLQDISFIRRLDFIWASPPCQSYSITKFVHNNKHPDLVDPVRQLLRASGLHYVIENVMGAPLIDPVMLCGTFFDLKVYRHRLFETNFYLPQPEHRPHRDNTPGVGRGLSNKGFISITGTGGFGIPNGFEYAQNAIGIDWMSRIELSQAIPPAYSEYIARWFFDNVMWGELRRPVQLRLDF